MTEQLMDNISNEEHDRLISISEHAIFPPLSPAAQAVLYAANYVYDRAGTTGHGLAAALRAAADQVVPENALYARSCCEFVGESARAYLLAIADELETHG